MSSHVWLMHGWLIIYLLVWGVPLSSYLGAFIYLIFKYFYRFGLHV